MTYEEEDKIGFILTLVVILLLVLETVIGALLKP